jgi:hypothetical protein
MSSSIPHICLTCQRVFPTLGLLGLHCAFLRHTPNPFCCIPCGLSFPDRINLAQALHFHFPTDYIDTNAISQKHGYAHSMVVVQASIGSAPMAALQHQQEGQDGGYGSAQPTDGAFHSEPSGQDLQPFECNICEKRFKKESALSMVSLRVQVPSRDCPSH